MMLHWEKKDRIIVQHQEVANMEMPDTEINSILLPLVKKLKTMRRLKNYGN